MHLLVTFGQIKDHYMGFTPKGYDAPKERLDRVWSFRNAIIQTHTRVVIVQARINHKSVWSGSTITQDTMMVYIVDWTIILLHFFIRHLNNGSPGNEVFELAIVLLFHTSPEQSLLQRLGSGDHLLPVVRENPKVLDGWVFHLHLLKILVDGDTLLYQPELSLLLPGHLHSLITAVPTAETTGAPLRLHCPQLFCL